MLDMLKSIPILKQLADALSDYPLVTSGVVLLLAFAVPYTGIDNAGQWQETLTAFAFFVYGGGSIWDFVAEWKKPTEDE